MIFLLRNHNLFDQQKYKISTNIIIKKIAHSHVSKRPLSQLQHPVRCHPHPMDSHGLQAYLCCHSPQALPGGGWYPEIKEIPLAKLGDGVDRGPKMIKHGVVRL